MAKIVFKELTSNHNVPFPARLSEESPSYIWKRIIWKTANWNPPINTDYYREAVRYKSGNL